MLKRTAPTLHIVPLPAFIPTIWVAGLNWKSHAEEVDLPIPRQPIFTMKSPSALLYPPSLKFMPESNDSKLFCGNFGNTIIVPRELQEPPEVDYEGELAVFIKNRCFRLHRNDVIRYEDKVIAGYACAMDITARRLQGKKGGNQWVVAKSYPTFLPIGPEIKPLKLDDLPNSALTTRLNGKIVQHARFSDMIFDVATLVSYLSNVCVLHPGTVILTGTPAGVGFARKAKLKAVGTEGDGSEKMVPDPYYLMHGDELQVDIDYVGSIKCTVEHEGKTGAKRLPV